MIRYFVKALWMHVSGARSLYLLTLLGVALGVGSVVCIQVLNQNALSAFSGGMRAVSGGADFTVVGSSPRIDEALLPSVLADPDVAAAWPVYQIHVLVSGTDDFFLEVIGFDFFAPVSVPLTGDEQDEPREDTFTSAEVLGVPGWIAISPALAEERGWEIGDTFEVSSGSRRATLRIGALVDFQRYAPLASRKLAVMDIAQAQSLLGVRGRIDQIDVVLREDADPEAAMRRLEAALGPGIQTLTSEEREQKASGLLEAFRLNLTALSLISLFVGVFLIYASVQASLVRRRPELGLLRSLGATRSQVLGLIFGEVLLLGLLGTAAGIPIGYFAATQNVGVVSATLTNIYLLQEIETLEIPIFVYVLGALVGIGGALAGAVLPALDMSRRDTRSLLVASSLHERTTRAAVPLALLAGSIAVLGGVWYAWIGSQWRGGGFVLGLILLLVLPLVSPWVVREIARRVPVRGLDLGLSIKNLAVRLQTTAVSVAALAVAVSMLFGITILIGSFRQTLATWVETSIRADIYVTTQSWARAGSDATLDRDVIERMRALPEVRGIETLRQIQTYTGDRRIQLGGLSLVLKDDDYGLPLRDGDRDEALRRLRAGEAALISEPLALKEGMGVGDTLFVMTPGGQVGYPIAGVTFDYSSEAGAAVVSMQTLERDFGPGPVHNAALFLADGVDAERMVDRVRAIFPDVPLDVRSNQNIRDEIFRIFDQTFAITRILQGMALLIAVAGVTLTLLVLARERVAELALYRAIGAMRVQIFRIFVGEGMSLGLLGLILGFAGGIVLALILIYVINPAFFGWTIRADWPWGAIAQQSAIIVLASIGASLYPALRASRVPAQELSRDDL